MCLIREMIVSEMGQNALLKPKLKMRSKCHSSGLSSDIIASKDLLKKNFELCKSFQLLPESDELQFSYSRAETSLKQKKKPIIAE